MDEETPAQEPTQASETPSSELAPTEVTIPENISSIKDFLATKTPVTTVLSSLKFSHSSVTLRAILRFSF